LALVNTNHFAGITDHIWSIKEPLTFPNCFQG